MIEFEGTTPLLKARDLDETVAFYTRLLGFESDQLWPTEEPGLCMLERGHTRLMFSTGADWDTPGAPPTLTGQLVFELSGVAELYEKLRGQVEVLWGPEVYAYGRREFSIRDPNGYRLVFSEPTDDPPTDLG